MTRPSGRIAGSRVCSPESRIWSSPGAGSAASATTSPPVVWLRSPRPNSAAQRRTIARLAIATSRQSARAMAWPRPRSCRVSALPVRCSSLTRHLLDGGALLVEDPAYEPLWRAADALGARVDRFTRERIAARPRSRVFAALHADTRIVAITNPHNPSGCVLDDETLSTLAGFAEGARRLAVGRRSLPRDRRAPRTPRARLAPNVITCSSVTKCLGVPWARAGWLLLPAELAEPATRIELYTVGMAPPSSWAWGERALSSADALLERARRLQAGKRAHRGRLCASPRARLAWTPPPDAGWFGWFTDARGRHLTNLIERGIEVCRRAGQPRRILRRSALVSPELDRPA